ncbi:MAG: ribonuclease III [Spirochaetia bacterium]|nr:ribonuclease III [Spirochaetia bacterium]
MREDRKNKIQEFIEKYNLSQIPLELIDQALTHKSYANEHKAEYINYLPLDTHNQRLEFLGDAVLGMVIAKALFENLPDDNEGILTRKKAQAVCEATLGEIGSSLKIGELLLLGKGEKAAEGNKRISIIADTTEALLGAIFLGAGYAKAESFILETWKPYIEGNKTAKESFDYKSRLQEWLMGQKGIMPYYKILSAKGPEHEKTFHVALIIQGEQKTEAFASNRKRAEQEAAKKHLENEGVIIHS